MKLDKVTYDDLLEIAGLQPDGWNDIITEFRSYIQYEFCNPVKVKIENKIIGIGTSIMFENSGWLAHIIVDKAWRNKGIGFMITGSLIKDLRHNSIDTILLIATELGEPVYKKAGFRIVSDYIFFKREKPWIKMPVSEKIMPYKDDFYKGIIGLDKNISGENRERLIKRYLKNSSVFIENNEVTGFYLPGLGEGLIFADNPEAGIELMKLKYSKADKAVLPSENIAGIEFLERNGFVRADTKGKRMILGSDAG